MRFKTVLPIASVALLLLGLAACKPEHQHKAALPQGYKTQSVDVKKVHSDGHDALVYQDPTTGFWWWYIIMSTTNNSPSPSYSSPSVTSGRIAPGGTWSQGRAPTEEEAATEEDEGQATIAENAEGAPDEAVSESVESGETAATGEAVSGSEEGSGGSATSGETSGGETSGGDAGSAGSDGGGSGGDGGGSD